MGLVPLPQHGHMYLRYIKETLDLSLRKRNRAFHIIAFGNIRILFSMTYYAIEDKNRNPHHTCIGLLRRLLAVAHVADPHGVEVAPDSHFDILCERVRLLRLVKHRMPIDRGYACPALTLFEI